MSYKLKGFIMALFIHGILLQAQYFTNPILAGFYPDPSICRAGDDYYLTNSTFAYFPGLPIFHSKDLLNWKQIGSALNRPEQLNLDGAGVSRGLYAPAISYYNGTFYIVCTLVDKGGNFIITAKDPAGPWSNPVFLPEINGIDPSLYFEGDTEAYIVYNSIPPGNKSMYDGHRTIRINPIDLKTLKVAGPDRILVNGGTDFSKKPVWIEGPHVYKKENLYYLVCAEGGTGYNHSEVVFRARSLTDLFIPYENNPILTQRHLDPNRPNPITTTGHADLVEDKYGNWWGVFLGCRPYEGNHYNTGRETFMAPVVWKDGWPVFDLGGDAVKTSYPIQGSYAQGAERFNGDYLFRDDFNATELNGRYLFLRTPHTKWYTLAHGALTMQLQSATCSEATNPSFIGFRQPHLKGYASTDMLFNPKDSNEQAGLLVFQNEQHYYLLCLSAEKGKKVVQLTRGAGNKATDKKPIVLATAPVKTGKKSTLQLKVETTGNAYSFYYNTDGKTWKLLMDKVDARFLSTETAGGFVGVLYAMYASSNGKPTTNKAVFNWFECKTD